MESDGLFLTNRCDKCGRALTKLEIMERMSDPRGLCPCGSVEFHSTNFKWWEEFLLVRSWKMFLAYKLGRVPPPPSRDDVAERNRAVSSRASKMIDEMEEEEDMGRDMDSFGTVN